MLIVRDWMFNEAEQWYRDNPNECTGVNRDKVDSFDVELYFRVYKNRGDFNEEVKGV
jgi:hypothetical protein|tara:strand:- start:124 stop:294 length:171 start_codon:yes stop_codon:yes gene_type:complete